MEECAKRCEREEQKVRSFRYRKIQFYSYFNYRNLGVCLPTLAIELFSFNYHSNICIVFKSNKVN